MKKIVLNVGFFFLVTGYIYACPSSPVDGVHIVQKGENLYRISLKYGTTVENLRLWNNLSEGDVLYKCMELIVKEKGINLSPSATPQPKKAVLPKATNPTPKVAAVKAESTRVDALYSKQQGMSHIVQKGQTMKGIAVLYGYTENYFREFNGLINGEEAVEGTPLRSKECFCPAPSEVQNPPQVAEQPKTPPAEAAKQSEVVKPVEAVKELEAVKQLEVAKPVEVVKEPEAVKQPEVAKPVEAVKEKAVAKTEEKILTKAEAKKQRKAEAKQRRIDKSKAKEEAKEAKKTAAKPSENKSATEVKPTPPKSPSTGNGGMSTKEMAMLDEVNLLRSDPKGYIKHVEVYIENMKKGQEFGTTYKTAKELIKELSNAKPLQLVEAKDCIYQSASKHGKECQKVGKMGHQGKDGSWPWDRVTRECSDLKDGNENLIGGREDVRESVIMLLIDDGIDDRGHRVTLLNPEWKYAAFYYVGQVGQMPSCWVQNYGF